MEEKSKSMEFSPEKENHKPLWYKHKKALNRVLLTMRRHSLTPQKTQQSQIQTKQRVPLKSNSTKKTTKIQDFTHTDLISDKISLLSDEIMVNILSRLPKSQRNFNFLVSKRWLNLQGRQMKSIKILDWDFLLSRRVFFRFPDLTHVDLVNACSISPRNSGIICTHKVVSFHVGSGVKGKDWLFNDTFVINSDEVDKGLRILANGCRNLKKLVVVNASEIGLLNLAEKCLSLEELELLMCTDHVLRGIAACQNLQTLRLSGHIDGLYDSLVSDIGLTILAQGCKKLVKLELSGCKGSYEGIRAIGQCCQMLEEMTLCDHKMEDGWLFALSCFENLKTLRFLSCKRIDSGFEVDEHLGCCLKLKSLCLDKCQLRDQKSLRALFLLCKNVREVVVKNCWGLDDEMLSTATALSNVRSLSLEGCSLMTTNGLESVVISMNDLQSLKVKSCNKIKDIEVTPALSSVFSSLKDLKWKPDSKSILSSHLAGTGMGKRGHKFFKKTSCDWKSLQGS